MSQDSAAGDYREVALAAKQMANQAVTEGVPDDRAGIIRYIDRLRKRAYAAADALLACEADLRKAEKERDEAIDHGVAVEDALALEQAKFRKAEKERDEVLGFLRNEEDAYCRQRDLRRELAAHIEALMEAGINYPPSADEHVKAIQGLLEAGK